MKIFQCQACAQPAHFEADACESCECRLGYDPDLADLTAMVPAGSRWRGLADARRRYQPCANRESGGCNWLVPAGSVETFCVACRHNRVVPD
ncbi:zinc-ribbon domain-containing protein, partial [uncultured Methylobacterium sp.]|uniref:zinc-ribbon domain-containing protein n=1 Tax=uncultured Methylobacterium sp. TaxID=157278 RepID=UPI002595AF77